MSEYQEPPIDSTGLKSVPLAGSGEVFLKAVTAIRNPGRPLTDFTTVNFEFLDRYRTRVNVVERTHAVAGGRGIGLRDHHELMLPLVRAALSERES